MSVSTGNMYTLLLVRLYLVTPLVLIFFKTNTEKANLSNYILKLMTFFSNSFFDNTVTIKRKKTKNVLFKPNKKIYLSLHEGKLSEYTFTTFT